MINEDPKIVVNNHTDENLNNRIVMIEKNRKLFFNML